MPIVGNQGKPVLLVVKLVICPNEMLSFFVRCSFGRLALQSAYKAFNDGRPCLARCHVVGVRLCVDSNVGSHLCNIGKRTQW